MGDLTGQRGRLSLLRVLLGTKLIRCLARTYELVLELLFRRTQLPSYSVVRASRPEKTVSGKLAKAFLCNVLQSEYQLVGWV
jgi:hypothetical protein